MYRSDEPTLAGELTPERLANALALAAARDLQDSGTGTRARPTCRRRRRPTSRRSRTEPSPSVTAFSSSAAASVSNREGLSEYVDRRVRGMLAVRDAIRLVFRTQLDDAPEDRIVEARQLPERHLRFLCPPLRAALVARERQGLRGRSRPAAPALARKLTIRKPSAPPRPRSSSAGRWSAIGRSSMSRRAAEALAVSLNETGEIDWPRMEQVTGRTDRELAARTWQPCLPQSRRRRLGNRRPLSERQRARQTRGRPSGRGTRSVVSPQHRSARSRPARRPGAGRHRGAPRLVVDSGRPTSATSSAHLLDTAPDSVRVAHAEAIATWTVEIDYGAKIQRRQHDDPRHGALSRFRPDRARAQWPHADRL